MVLQRRFSTWGVPRFLQSFDETLDGGLILPRGSRDTVTSLADQPGSRLEITDDRVRGTAREFAFNAILTGEQREAVRVVRQDDTCARVIRVRLAGPPAHEGPKLNRCSTTSEHIPATDTHRPQRPIER